MKKAITIFIFCLFINLIYSANVFGQQNQCFTKKELTKLKSGNKRLLRVVKSYVNANQENDVNKIAKHMAGSNEKEVNNAKELLEQYDRKYKNICLNSLCIYNNSDYYAVLRGKAEVLSKGAWGKKEVFFYIFSKNEEFLFSPLLISGADHWLFADNPVEIIETKYN